MSPAYRLVRKVGWLLRLKLESQPGLIWRFAIAVLAGLIRIHGWTLRVKLEDHPGYFAGRIDRPVIVLLWHNRIFSTPFVWQRYRPPGRKALVLTSASPEGSLLSLVVSHFGLGAVRGSSSRQGSAAVRGMIARIAEGNDIFITPDGPRGPRYRLQPGAIALAQQTGAPIIAAHIEYSHYRRLKSWDGFAIALPFSTVRVVLDELYWINPDETPEELEDVRQHLQRVMTDSMLMD